MRVAGTPVEDPRSVLNSKPVRALGCLLVLATALWLIPGLERYRLWDRPKPEPVEETGLLSAEEQRMGTSELTQETRHREELEQPMTPTLAPRGPSPIAEAQEEDFELPRIDADEPPVSLIDESRSLDKFYASLSKTARKDPGAVTRVLYFGDSLVASDYVTGTLRRLLHDQFGDAGHGFVLIADAWPAYFHNDIFRFASKGWKVSRIVGPYSADGMYGLGGVSFEAPPGVRARFGTAEKGEYGRRVSRFRVLYLEQPYGGDIEVNVDGKQHAMIHTEAPEKGSGVMDIEVPDGEHMLELVTKRRMTRSFGVILERDGPGVVLDAVGIQGARIRFLDKQDDEHWAEQLKLRDPDLVVYQFGANESGDGFAYSMEDYHRTMKEIIEQGQAALPDAGCLVLAAMDRARKQGDWLITVPIIPHIVREQEATAKEVGCAFWNTYEAMGGKGSMAKWVRRGLGQADLTHPSGYGAQVLGNWIYQALIEGFNAYQAQQ